MTEYVLHDVSARLPAVVAVGDSIRRHFRANTGALVIRVEVQTQRRSWWRRMMARIRALRVVSVYP